MCKSTSITTVAIKPMGKWHILNMKCPWKRWIIKDMKSTRHRAIMTIMPIWWQTSDEGSGYPLL